MHTVPDSSVPADRESAQAHGRWIRVVELPRIELGSGLLSAFACCHVRRGVYLHLRGEGHPWTGAFGEPRTACRRCSYTGRANPSSDCSTSPIQIFRFQPVNRQWGGWNRVSHCEGETVKRNVVGVWGGVNPRMYGEGSCDGFANGCSHQSPARSKWFPAGYRKPVSPNDMGWMA